MGMNQTRGLRKGECFYGWYQVMVDGIPWEDADGHDAWETEREANSVAESVEPLGFTSVEIERL